MGDGRSRVLARSGLLLSAAALSLSSATVALVCLGTFAHVDIYFRGAAGWDFGVSSLVIAQFAAAARVLIWLTTAPTVTVRRALALVGIVMAVVSGATLVIGYIGHRATYTEVAASCHGEPGITARETNTFFRGRGALSVRYGIVLLPIPNSEYRPPLGTKPAASGSFTSECHSDGSITISFPTSGYATPIAPITIRAR